MKKFALLALCFIIYTQTMGVVYNVTVPAGTKACYIAGEMNNWIHREMQKVDDTHYTLTINEATTSHKYKYCSGPAWSYVENTPNGENRSYSANDVVTAWALVYDPGAVAVNVTYKVTVPPGTWSCYFAGVASDWQHREMNKVDDTHFSITLSTATPNGYKYCAGPGWDYEELNEAGQNISDRNYTAADVVVRWKAVYTPPSKFVSQSHNIIVSSGKLDRYYTFNAKIMNRNVDIWLPAGYSTDNKYAVLYMHDGQNLWDATKTGNQQEWRVDETISELLQNALIRNVIVVGIGNTTNRYGDYYPEKSLEYLPANIKTQKMNEFGNNPKGDEYLEYIVKELKPFIDSHYSVLTDKSNTFIAGSSMGGLISWYALCEYPQVFGGAACLSTHWANNSMDDPSIPDSFRKYLLNKLPDPEDHKIYFDHGTAELDANYPQHQVLVDTIMRYKKYTDQNWITRVFQGSVHNENAWAFRFNIPVKFLLTKNEGKSLALKNDFTGASFECGSQLQIAWKANSIPTVRIEFSSDKGETWTEIATVPATDSIYNWTLPAQAWYECKIRITDSADNALTTQTKGMFVVYNHLPENVNPLLSHYIPVFVWPYNAKYPVTTNGDSEYINGRVGNACGPTAISNILAYWGFPRKGFGNRTFIDGANCTWSADFAATTYNYDLITDRLTASSPQAVIDANATLLYHAGVAMHDAGRSGNRDGVLNAFKEYFGYNKKAKIINRDDYTPAQWEKVFRSELSLGRPQIVEGWSQILPNGNHDGHWFICDGYDKNGSYHVSYDYGPGTEKWYPLYEFGVYKLKNWIFAYLEPDLKGKKIALTSPAGNENWQQNTQKSITWSATGVTSVNIEFSSDNGATWTTLATAVPAGSGSRNLTLPAVVSEQCKIRVSDATDINIYQSNKNVFSLYDSKEVTLLSSIPAYTAQKNILPLRWNAKGFQVIRVEYTTNNGTTWNLIADTLAQAKSVRWTIPAIAPATCRIRVSDKSDPQVYAISNPFNIGEKPLAGGPYAPDENTVMLLHFDQLHRNEAIPSNIVTPYNSISFEENFGLGLDYCGKITNDGQGASSCLKLDHHPSFHLYGDWSIEFWFKINSWGTATTEYPLLFEKPGANFSIGLSPSSKTIRAAYDLSAGGSVFLTLPSNSLSSGLWYHFLFVRNTVTNEITCQLRDADRKLVNSQSRTFIANQTPKMDTQPVLIGGVSMGSNIQFDGCIDELRVSNVVRDFQTASPVIPGRKLICYPNPTTGKVRVSGLHSTDESLIFTNLNGSKLLERNLTGQVEVELDISHLPAGVYVLQVVGKNGTAVERIIRE